MFGYLMKGCLSVPKRTKRCVVGGKLRWCGMRCSACGYGELMADRRAPDACVAVGVDAVIAVRGF
jgi:hypothetical protein